MIETATLPYFLAAATLLIVIPGPSVFYIVSRSLDQGRLAGIISTLGVSAGGLVHVAAAAAGLSALLASSAVAFNTVKYLGAAYLIYLGVRRLMARAEPMAPATGGRQPLVRTFYEGMVVNMLNPKTALFFLAFLPQFVNPSAGPVSLQVMVLGVLFVAVAIVSDSVYALLAGGIGDLVKRRASGFSRLRLFSGGVYIALGLVTAVSGPGRGK